MATSDLPPDATAAARPASPDASAVGSLGDQALMLGAHAALLGDGFTLATLQALTELPPDTFAPSLAELCASGVLTVDAAGYRFGPTADREALYGLIGPDERIQRHAAAARHLALQLDEATPAGVLGAIARHHLAANDAEGAVTFALKGGLAHFASHEHAEAERLLDMGLALLKKEGRAAWRRLRLDYLTALGDVWRLTGRLELARTTYLEALQVIEALNEAALVGPMLTSLAQVMQGLDAWEEAERLADRAVKACLMSGEPGHMARSLLTTVRIHLHRGRIGEAQAQAQRAMDLCRESGDTARLAEALALVGYMHTAAHPKRLAEGVACLHESIALLSDQPDRGGILLSYMLLGNAQLAMGDFAGAGRAFAIARWICEDTGNRTEAGIAWINIALASLELGRLEEGLDAARAARQNAELLANRYQFGLATAVEALAAAHLGRIGEAAGCLAEAEAACEQQDNPYMSALVLLWTHEARLLMGDVSGALRAGETLAAIAAATGNIEHESRANALMAETLARLGDRPAALKAAQQALVAAETAKAEGDQVRALRAIALISAEDGDRAGARRLAEMAAAQSRRQGGAYQTALLEGLLGELARRDHPPAAQAHFQAMAALADEMGCAVLKAQALAGLGDLPAARTLLTALIAGLDDTNKQHFLSFPERRRILRSAGTGPLNPTEAGL